MQTRILKKNWTPNPEAFQCLLEWLDNGENSDGGRYLEIRRRLVYFFDRKDCRNSDDLADETLNRVARRLEEEGEIRSETPAKFCYLTAKFVFLESLRDSEKRNISFDEVIENKLVTALTHEDDLKEKRLDCLENCADKLEVSSREIIFGYYYGAERAKIENRRNLAVKFDISINALSIRACRIREKLQICVEKCLGKR
jgi:DNA-directed RNA polymerase specialized sigma24 family protein